MNTGSAIHKHAGKARGTRMNAKAMFSPRADKRLAALVQYEMAMDGRTNGRSAVFLQQTCLCLDSAFNATATAPESKDL